MIDESIPPNSKEAVLQYCRARLAATTAMAEAEAASTKYLAAQQTMQDAWRHCKGATSGVYAFEDMGRLVVVVDPLHDYPALLSIVK